MNECSVFDKGLLIKILSSGYSSRRLGVGFRHLLQETLYLFPLVVILPKLVEAEEVAGHPHDVIDVRVQFSKPLLTVLLVHHARQLDTRCNTSNGTYDTACFWYTTHTCFGIPRTPVGYTLQHKQRHLQYGVLLVHYTHVLACIFRQNALPGSTNYIHDSRKLCNLLPRSPTTAPPSNPRPQPSAADSPRAIW